MDSSPVRMRGDATRALVAECRGRFFKAELLDTWMDAPRPAVASIHQEELHGERGAWQVDAGPLSMARHHRP